MNTTENTTLEDMISFANKESDRGCALILSANVETRLGELIKASCVDLSRETNKRLFNGNGVLATFSARIDMCYALGLLGDTEFRDLNLIRKIRNKFAHSEHGLSFESPAVKDRCFEFGLVKEMEADYPEKEYQVPSPRDRFQILVASLCLMISHRAELASKNRKSVPKSNSILPART